MHPKKQTYYAFADVVTDVLYGIILYNAFIAFTGFNINSLFLLFATFLMLNYWWAMRTSPLPKHHLFDLYFLTGIIFVLSLLPTYITDPYHFFITTAALLGLDAAYCFVSLYLDDRVSGINVLWFYGISELGLGLLYGITAMFTDHFSLQTLLLILYIPYLVWFILSFKWGGMSLKFVDTGNQPY